MGRPSDGVTDFCLRLAKPTIATNAKVNNTITNKSLLTVMAVSEEGERMPGIAITANIFNKLDPIMLPIAIS